MLLCGLGVVALLAFYVLPAGEVWEAENAAYRKNDFVTAMKAFGPLAERGDVNAQYNVGVMYGQGDDAAVAAWYCKVAE